MIKAALPAYMNKHVSSQDIPPGHRFGLYFPIWKDDWKKADQEKTTALEKATHLSAKALKVLSALCQRQQAIALQHESIRYFPATSTSPFVTGMGNEHPLENGFSFLNPYGLPYLPGSSIKGVLRSAAEELALGLYGETEGWDMLAVWWLFGFEAGSAMLSQKHYGIDVLDEEASRRCKLFQEWVIKNDYDQDTLDQFILATVAKKDQKKYLENRSHFLSNLPEELSNQGVLRFWDVYPQSKQLAMDILTPHHSGYFQGKNAPHDSEQPVPNVFLTIPPKSEFHFYSTCEIARLPKALQKNWQGLLQSAFNYAFDWLGFGAKTAVGYGQVSNNRNAEQEWLKQINKREQAAEDQRQQQELEKNLEGLSSIAQEFIRAMEKGKWLDDKQVFWQNSEIEAWLDKLMETPDELVINHIKDLFDKHFPGLRVEPNKTKGKKKKFVFSDKQRSLALKLSEL